VIAAVTVGPVEAPHLAANSVPLSEKCRADVARGQQQGVLDLE